jgi:hypothetical protein
MSDPARRNPLIALERVFLGAWRMARGEPEWRALFEDSRAGLVRSFLAPLLALPFDLLALAVLRRGEPWPKLEMELWAGAATTVMVAAGYPLVMLAVTRAFGFSLGLRLFIIVLNWAFLALDLFNMILTPTALLDFSLYASIEFMLLLPLTFFVIWRATDETLSTEWRVKLMCTVLYVGVLTGAQVLADFAFPS